MNKAGGLLGAGKQFGQATAQLIPAFIKCAVRGKFNLITDAVFDEKVGPVVLSTIYLQS